MLCEAAVMASNTEIRKGNHREDKITHSNKAVLVVLFSGEPDSNLDGRQMLQSQIYACR